MGQAKQTCDLCQRQPGTPHLDRCARSRAQQRALAEQSGSLRAPGWLHVSTVVVLDAQVEAMGDFKLPANGPRSGPGLARFYQLPGEPYTRPPLGKFPGTPPGAGGRAKSKVARYAWSVPIPASKPADPEEEKVA